MILFKNWPLDRASLNWVKTDSGTLKYSYTASD